MRRTASFLMGAVGLFLFGVLLGLICLHLQLLPSVMPTPVPAATILFVDDTPTSTATPISFICTPLPTSTPEATQTPTATPHVGAIIVHAWVDEEGIGVWDTAAEPVAVEVVFIAREPVPTSYPAGWSLCTGEPELYQKNPRQCTGGKGIAVNGIVWPGSYDIWIVGLANGNFLVPEYDNVWRVTVKADDQSIVNLRFQWWRATWTPTATVTATRPATSTPTASATATQTMIPTVTVAPSVTVTPTASATVMATPTGVLHQCPMYWYSCIPIDLACPIGTVPDVLGVCGSAFRCCVPATPTATQ